MSVSHIASFDLRRVPLTLLGLASFFLILAGQAHAGAVAGFLADKNGAPVQDAVLFATPLGVPMPPAKPSEPAVVAQEGYAFSPYVSVIRVGTSVRFPNRDPHDHHLKSFSPAKPFELRTYSKKEEPTPILFDKTGDVVLVCHFHNWMRGFIYVVDTPYFAKTDKEGNAFLNNLPAGRYEVKAWAPNMLGAPLAQTVQVGASGSTPVKFQFNYVPKPAPAPRKPPKDDDYYSY